MARLVPRKIDNATRPDGAYNKIIHRIAGMDLSSSLYVVVYYVKQCNVMSEPADPRQHWADRLEKIHFSLLKIHFSLKKIHFSLLKNTFFLILEGKKYIFPY